jgi:hypothetical protein
VLQLVYEIITEVKVNPPAPDNNYGPGLVCLLWDNVIGDAYLSVAFCVPGLLQSMLSALQYVGISSPGNWQVTFDENYKHSKAICGCSQIHITLWQLTHTQKMMRNTLVSDLHLAILCLTTSQKNSFLWLYKHTGATVRHCD